MGTVFHQRFNIIVNEELRAKVAAFKGKEAKNITEADIQEYIDTAVIPEGGN